MNEVGYKIDEAADMTPYQQLVALGGGADKTLLFKNSGAYYAWLANRKR